MQWWKKKKTSKAKKTKTIVEKFLTTKINEIHNQKGKAKQKPEILVSKAKKSEYATRRYMQGDHES